MVRRLQIWRNPWPVLWLALRGTGSAGPAARPRAPVQCASRSPRTSGGGTLDIRHAGTSGETRDWHVNLGAGVRHARASIAIDRPDRSHHSGAHASALGAHLAMDIDGADSVGAHASDSLAFRQRSAAGRRSRSVASVRCPSCGYRVAGWRSLSVAAKNVWVASLRAFATASDSSHRIPIRVTARNAPIPSPNEKLSHRFEAAAPSP